MHFGIALVLTSFGIGLIVTYLVPWVLSILGGVSTNATYQSVLSNKWAQVLLIGLIVAVGIGAFVALSRHLKLPVRVPSA